MHITGVKWGALAMVATLAACGGSDNYPYPTLNGDKPLVCLLYTSDAADE